MNEIKIYFLYILIELNCMHAEEKARSLSTDLIFTRSTPKSQGDLNKWTSCSFWIEIWKQWGIVMWTQSRRWTMASWRVLAGCCRNVIVAPVKQGEVKKQERAVLYLADYPHASSRLQGERAESLNRQERAEHSVHTHTHTQSICTLTHTASGQDATFPNYLDWKELQTSIFLIRCTRAAQYIKTASIINKKKSPIKTANTNCWSKTQRTEQTGLSQQ